MKIHYDIVDSVLRRICWEAPESYKSYKFSKKDPEPKIVNAKSKALIHLFLHVKCGLVNFEERHALITDGPQDGGLDAFYIDSEGKRLLLIQSKFAATASNFESKKIAADELVKMEITRILKGEKNDSRGKPFSKKIQAFQRKWAAIKDPALYKYQVVLLGNVRGYTIEQIKRLIDSNSYEIYDGKKIYAELIFPLCSATYFDPKEITIAINLDSKEQPTLKQQIVTDFGTFPVRIIFVPTKEIGRIMLRYKNAILKFNPRNYLALARNKVNAKIMKSIVDSNNNDFAIYNNGITIIADTFEQTETTGQKNIGQIIMQNPQIINGGQTAYVLSKIFETHGDLKVFENKEVMLKAIIVQKTDLNSAFVEKISSATNQQTKVEEADRRSNDEIQVNVQKAIYDRFGYFFERKKGEFHYGLEKRYVNKNNVIDRFDFIKSYLAWQGDPSNARRSGADAIFKEERFKRVMKKERDVATMFLAYKVYKRLVEIEKKDERHHFGGSIKYGKLAIVTAAGILCHSAETLSHSIDDDVEKLLKATGIYWKDFISYARKRTANKAYILEKNLDFNTYYKGGTVNSDLLRYFRAKKKVSFK